MNRLKSFLLILLFSAASWAETEASIIQVSDTINPGTADYIVAEINKSNLAKAPYLILQLDTPGGLLNSTRKIVQAMLNSKIPIVVWIGPKGAQAGSAGALITFAADVATMATGTNIGAAHPVDASGRSMDKTMSDKITHDTAAFASSLAKAKGRNIEWAKESVYSNKSISSDEAVKLKVIDFIADDLTDLELKLRGYRLTVPKEGISQLPSSAQKTQLFPATIKQKIVSFFANPSLAYLILSLGGLCIWIELSHPGLIFPGVLGALCVLISLVSFQLLPIRFGALGMLLLGIALLIAELYVTSYGVLGIGGILSFVLGSLYLMDTNVPEFQISLSLIFPVATCLALSVFILSYIIWKSRHLKVADGYHSLIGTTTEAHSEITKISGNIFIQGELWSARSEDGLPIKQGALVQVQEVRGLQLIVKKKEN